MKPFDAVYCSHRSLLFWRSFSTLENCRLRSASAARRARSSFGKGIPIISQYLANAASYLAFTAPNALAGFLETFNFFRNLSISRSRFESARTRLNVLLDITYSVKPVTRGVGCTFEGQFSCVNGFSHRGTR